MARTNPFFTGASEAPREQHGSRVPARRDGAPAAKAEASRPWTVSALVAEIKGALADAFPQRVAVVGEISNCKLHSSGHLYFRLKDARSAIDAVMWRSQASRLKFEPEDGLEVVADGRVDVYEVRGQLQLYVERMSPKGTGALELAFRQLREKLEREGLFDPSVKKPLARFPRGVGVVTSPTGAAIRDIRRTLLRRWPGVRVYVLPVLVQGDEAAGQIADAVRRLDAAAERLGIDTLIVTRGGGSLEDLWAFNEEAVARAIHAARTPIVSGVGHEVDVTIADLVADVRAATPTAAAEVAVPDRAELARTVADLAARLSRTTHEAVRTRQTALAGVLRSVAFRDPMWRVRTETQRIDELGHRLSSGLRGRLAGAHRKAEPLLARLAELHPRGLIERASSRLDRLFARMRWAAGARSKRSGDALARLTGRLGASHPRHLVRLARQKLKTAERQLEALSYRKVLGRGFSVTRGPDGRVLRSVSAVTAGARIETEVRDGRIASRVETAKPGRPGRSEPAPGPRRATQAKSCDGGPTLFDAT